MSNEEKPFKYLIEKIFENAEKETFEKGKDHFLWIEWHNNWIDIIQPILRVLFEEEKKKSLLIIRLIQFQKDLLWINKSIFSGAYHTTIRELRYIFEYTLQAYYIDVNHSDSNIECKLEIMKELNDLKFSGGRLIQALKIENKDKLQNLYSKLSAFIHPSYEELTTGKMNSRVLFGFDEELYNACKELTNRTMDAIFYITLFKFSIIKEKIKENKLLIDSFKKFDCKLTLKLLNI